MPKFFDLPRELRDLIYTQYLTSTRPLPEPSSTSNNAIWNRPWESTSGLGDHGCAFAVSRAPNTCANLLAVNRQIHAEMQAAIERARRKNELNAKIDCIALGDMHYFTWLSIPLVKTGTCEHSRKLGGVLPTWAARYLIGSPGKVLGGIGSGGGHTCRAKSTTIERLWIDIRAFPDSEEERNRTDGGNGNANPGAREGNAHDRTAWAICAALKHVFEHDPDAIPTRDCVNDVCVGEVVLNIVALPSTPSPTPNPLPLFSEHHTPAPAPASIPSASTESTQKQNLALARSLVEVWNKLWSGDEFKARYYRNLLSRIRRVRVCIQGETFRVRDVGEELERGQRERRRIEMRMR